MEIGAFQRVIRETYLEKDRARGIPATFMWFVNEVGELAEALRKGDHEAKAGEFADVFAWLTTLANVAEVDLETALAKYSGGCCGCGNIPCSCADADKP